MNNISKYHNCNGEKLCYEMAKQGLQKGINGLKENQHCTRSIILILESIMNLLSEYECAPCSCLFNRVNYVHKHIAPVSNTDVPLYPVEKTMVDMLISELSTFVSNTNDC